MTILRTSRKEQYLTLLDLTENVPLWKKAMGQGIKGVIDRWCGAREWRMQFDIVIQNYGLWPNVEISRDQAIAISWFFGSGLPIIECFSLVAIKVRR